MEEFLVLTDEHGGVHVWLSDLESDGGWLGQMRADGTEFRPG